MYLIWNFQRPPYTQGFPFARTSSFVTLKVPPWILKRGGQEFFLVKKFLWSLLKVTEVTTEHQNQAKKQHKQLFFGPKGKRKPRPKDEALRKS